MTASCHAKPRTLFEHTRARAWPGLMVLLASSWAVAAMAHPQDGGSPASAAAGLPPPAKSAPVAWFDDFKHRTLADLKAAGWVIREAAGHPGVPGALWGDKGVALLPGEQREGWLRLTAHTTGAPSDAQSLAQTSAQASTPNIQPVTQQAQICHQRRYLAGTYAARVRFSDQPVSGVDGDPIIQTFYAASPLNMDYDPKFSELDWEYLANGGWGSPDTRLYSITWQTVRLDPWDAHNQAQETPGSHAGWRVLTMHVGSEDQPGTRFFLDGQPVARHGGRTQPVSPMAISFNLWFSPTGLGPLSATPRVYVQDVDWVVHLPQQWLTPEQVRAQVKAWQSAGQHHIDTLPASAEALPSLCNL